MKGEVTTPVAIPDKNPAGVGSVIALVGAGVVGKVTLKLSIKHTWVGDLRVELLAPSGKRVVLRNQAGGSADDIEATFTSEPPSPLAGLVGESIQGNWILRVADLVARDTGTLQRWSLEVEPK